MIVTVVYKSTVRAQSATLNAAVEDINSILWPSEFAPGGKHVITGSTMKGIAMKAIIRTGAREISRKANQVRFVL